jgi:hypothetical protein
MISVGTRVREPALVPCAALAFREAVRPLLVRLLELDEPRLLRLRALRGREFLLIQGNADDLPWSDGLIYLGKDEAAPRLLLPTTLAPNVPSALFERGLARHCATGPRPSTAPWAVSLEPPLVVSLAEARPLSLRAARAWLDLSPLIEPP